MDDLNADVRILGAVMLGGIFVFLTPIIAVEERLWIRQPQKTELTDSQQSSAGSSLHRHIEATDDTTAVQCCCLLPEYYC